MLNVKPREGRRIAKMRWEEGMSINDICNKTKRSTATVRRWVDRFKPSQAILDKFADKRASSLARDEVTNWLGRQPLPFEEALINRKQPTPLKDVIDTAALLEAISNERNEIEEKLKEATKKYEEAVLRFKPRTLTR